jgi:predicted pyridoxine 5'-phosphate oxidase superfamily flavin-nucleotide-binding protein
MKLPGSQGEHQAQEAFGTTRRALTFYHKQMLHYLNPLMREFITRQEMVFIATADGHGACDCSFRAGFPGFVHVLNDTTLAYPEYRGNGVMASVGNIMENPHIGMIFIDFFESTVGLHVNGKAHVVENEALLARPDVTPELSQAIQTTGGRCPERWILVEVEEAYIHCSKHVPLLHKLDKAIHWGTDDEHSKGGDYFKAKACPRPWGPEETNRQQKPGAGSHDAVKVL